MNGAIRRAQRHAERRTTPFKPAYGPGDGEPRQLDAQSTAFDEMMDQQSENMREINTLRDAQMAQRKADDGITKKFIESIGE